MKKVLIAIVILAALAALAAAWVLSREAPAPDPSPEPSFPISGAPGGGMNVPGSATRTISAYDGRELIVQDFLASADAKEDPVNEGYYYLGYQPAGDDPIDAPYLISYTEDGSHFNITILKEPIGATRQEAEASLKARLLVDEQALCGLNYTVAVPYAINSVYAGINLGFSFCPGAVALP